jgi:multimeric flavodoxin WrbA
MKIAVLSGSSRPNGNTETLALRAVEKHNYKLFNLRDYHIDPINDLRHDPNGFQPVDDDYEELIKELLEYDVWVYATPIYWYGMSGVMKNFVDRWSQFLRDPQLQFKEKMSQKKAYVVICGGDQAKVKGLPLIMQFKYIFDFVGTEFGGYVIGQASKPEDINKDAHALEQAKSLLEV